MELLCQGAESRIYIMNDFCGKPTIIKERLSKSYRVKELDIKINKQRLLQETRCMVKCRRAGVTTPSIYLIDLERNRIYIEKINGKTFKDILWDKSAENLLCRKQLLSIARNIGVSIGRMHDADVVHGDLTTSNIMVRLDVLDNIANMNSITETIIHNNNNNDGINITDTNSTLSSIFTIVIIDFGLGMMKSTIDDKAVDLYVLERAFLSTHPGSQYLIDEILDSYRFSCRKGTPILVKLEQVRQRGRKRDMIG